MALVDVSEIVTDPDFLDDCTIIRRTATVGSTGRGTLTEASEDAQVVIQAVDGKTLRRLPEGARPSAAFSMWYAGTLTAEGAGVYPDVVVWGGRRFQVQTIVEDFTNGGGYTHATLSLEAAGA